MSKPTYGPSIFIGREKEIEIFTQMLDNPIDSQWILHLYGDGGIGKTQLLHRFAEIATQRQGEGQPILVTAELIDLYWTAHQREIGILKSIADQLVSTEFASFYEALDTYEQLIDREEATDPLLIAEWFLKVSQQFLDIYKQLADNRVVLLFDTVELAGDSIISFWQNTLPALKKANPNTLVVMAGRKRLEKIPAENTNFHSISGFTTEEIELYFEHQKLKVPSDIVARIAEFSEGRPILVALTIDWIRFGNAPQDLVAYGAEEFEQAMVERVQQLRYPEDQVILAMAHLHRRFDEDILAYVLDQDPQIAANLLHSLERFSFVKYRPAVEDQLGSCLLHDEMRYLVNEYVWKALDPSGDYRRNWNRKIIDYYAQKIEAEPNVTERQDLSLERLFYWLDVDVEAAFAYSRELFEPAEHTRLADLMEALNQEIRQADVALSPEMQSELAFREAVVLHERGRYPETIDKLSDLLDNPTCPSHLQPSIRARLVESYTYSGSLHKAIEAGLEWERWFETLLAGQQPDDPARQSIEQDFGWLCNTIGLAYRNQNKLNRTIAYYIKALDHFSKLEGAYPLIAATKNNLGYVYHRLGRYDEALSECNTALKIRKQLNSPNQLGYSYNVLGMIYVDLARPEEAVDYFKRALREFDEAESERGRGLVYISYGRLLRQWGWYKETFVDEPFDPDRKEYREAGQMLDEAIRIFKRLNALSELSEAFNDRGTLLRNQRKWQVAIQDFRRSIELSRQIGNRYREIDNLVDIAILYNYSGELERALAEAEKAGQLAQELRAYYLFAKAQKVAANVRFARREYDQAFEAAANSCIYVMRLDPEEIGASPAKRELYYDEMVGWVSEMILKLPSHELAKEKAEFLIHRWEEEETAGRRLSESYPGFIIRIRDLASDYPFLAT